MRTLPTNLRPLACGLMLALATAGANAASIPGLFNTGAGFLADQQDTHYALSKVGGTADSNLGSYGYVTSDNVWPVQTGVWLTNASSPASKWLTPLDNQAASLDPPNPNTPNNDDGIYKWVLTFDLTGYNPATASLSGHFATDNSGVAKLNGNVIGTSAGFSTWSNLSVLSNMFVSGVNTLEFFVTNLQQASGNPTGLRVEFTDSEVSAVPLPAAAWLFGSALLGFMAMSKKRRV